MTFCDKVTKSCYIYKKQKKLRNTKNSVSVDKKASPYPLKKQKQFKKPIDLLNCPLFLCYTLKCDRAERIKQRNNKYVSRAAQQRSR